MTTTPSSHLSRDESKGESQAGARPASRAAAAYCRWCGLRLEAGDGTGRKRRYCGQPCRQRAYERRSAAARGGLPSDAVVLSRAEVTALQDRLFQVRCAAEDIVTAADDHAPAEDMRDLAGELVRAAKDLEQFR